MAKLDEYLDYTGLDYYHSRIKTLFPSKAEFNALDDKVDGIIAEGGEPNVIEVVQKNGTALPVSNKTVNVTVPTTVAELSDASDYAQTSDIPTKTSDLTNDGDGSDNNSPFATEAYVAANGGKIDTIKVNGTTQTITNKAVDITVPTKTSDLTNDSGFQDSQDVQDAIDAALADITGIDFQVVQSLPQSGEKGVIYLVPNSGTGTNTYDEYIWVEPSGGTAHFEKIGSTDVDLSGYWSKTELVAITTAEIDTIVNGS